MSIQIWPSILTADFGDLKNELIKIKASGCKGVHLDVMDNHFVPNLTFGPAVIKKIRTLTDLPLDAHLMVYNPQSLIEPMVDAGVQLLSIHVEADLHLFRTLDTIKKAGMKAGVALNPGTPINSITECLDWIDFVLIMTVEPGFGGQSFIPSMVKKIKELYDIIKLRRLNIAIEVDGGINEQTVKSVADAGATMLVSGSAFFNAANPAEYVKNLKYPKQLI
jgi:ribulose-phosphate 3-epimerase